MRELTLEEQELIAGGVQTDATIMDDIVVTSGGDDGGWLPPMPGGDGGGDGGGGWGGGGGGGGDGGSGGGGDDGPTFVDADVNVETNEYGEQTGEITVTAPVDPVQFIAVLDVPSFDLKSLAVSLNDNGQTFTTTLNLQNGSTNASYGFSMGGGFSGTAYFTLNGSDSGVGLSISFNRNF